MTFYCTNCWKEIDKDACVCPYCSADLSELDKVSFTGKLIHALNHPEPATPIRAAEILGKLKVIEAIPSLIKKSENEKDPYIIKAIVDALINIDAENTKKFILKILADNPPVTVKHQIEELEKIKMSKKIELSETHARSLAVTARHIDKGIRELKSILLNENNDTSVLTTVKNLTPEKRNAILELLKILKIRNEKLIKDFNLPAEQMYEDRIVRGKISMMWVLLSDSTSKGLKGYGEMPVEQAIILDEHIESLLEIIYKLQEI